MKHLLKLVAVALASPVLLLPHTAEADKTDGLKVRTHGRHGGTRRAQLGYVGHQRPVLTTKPAFDHLHARAEHGGTASKTAQLDTAFKSKTHFGLVAGVATQ